MNLFQLTRRESLGLLAGLNLPVAGTALISAGASTKLAAQVSQANHSALPVDFIPQLVRAQKGQFAGRECMTVELTDEAQRRVLSSAAGNGPSYVMTPLELTDGVIEVDIAAELTGKGGSDARGFVGLAFHISEDAQTYEAVYLRMTNGTLNIPPPPAPRNVRAIQYVAHPNFHFNVSRDQFPARYERPAAIALARWHRLKLEIQGARLQAFVDDVSVLEVTDLRYANRKGRVGLWVDDGSRGHFADLKILPKS
jgi:hypothetical protein